MKPSFNVERLIFVLAVVLSLAALWLAFIAPPDLMNTHAVYQGF